MGNRFSVLLSFCAAVFLFSCEESIEGRAMLLLEEARQASDAGNYNSAKMLIDSISVAYPKAYKTRREAELLRRSVMLVEKERDVRFHNSSLESLLMQKDSLLKEFDFNKDSHYQDMGYYTVPSQSIKLNPFNNFLRAYVKENGDTYLTSFYRGKRIAHYQVRISAEDSFVECDKPFLSRSYKESGVYNERRDFKYGSDAGLMDFVSSSGGPFKVELTGEYGKYEYTLRYEDAVAITQILELSVVLKAIEETTAMRDEAQRAFDFLKKSQKRSEAVPALPE